MEKNLEQLVQKKLNEEIPISIAMGIEVIQSSVNGVRLKAPLENNINHKRTAFGGSLYSILVLSGWCYVYVLLKEYNINAHIVIHKSEINYLEPVGDDYQAYCHSIDNKDREKFIRQYKRAGKARLQLNCEIKTANKQQVSFTGNYVIHS